MDATQAKEIIDKIVGQIFGYQNPLSLEQFMNKFAFDVRLPQQVYDSTTNQPTWAQSTNPARFITMDNARKRAEVDDWIMPKRPINSLQDMLTAWNEVNLTATERQIESINLSETDNIYFSENIYRSQDINKSKNVVFSDGLNNCEFVGAGQRSNSSSFCVRLEDSQTTSNSFSVSWSGNISNSFFIHDCKDVSDSMFCSHISSKRFCIANMQFEEEEYNRLKQEVIKWILTA
jgi:hypothetical protein